jgi:hypothetical protein
VNAIRNLSAINCRVLHIATSDPAAESYQKLWFSRRNTQFLRNKLHCDPGCSLQYGNVCLEDIAIVQGRGVADLAKPDIAAQYARTRRLLGFAGVLTFADIVTPQYARVMTFNEGYSDHCARTHARDSSTLRKPKVGRLAELPSVRSRGKLLFFASRPPSPPTNGARA